MNLISRSLLFIIFYFLFSHARAQVGEYRTDLAIGFNGGYVMTNVSFTPDVPQDLLGGMTGGLTIRYTCEKYFSSICAITAEVNYTQAGWKERILDVNDQPVYYEGDNSNPLRYQRRITYVQVPLLARLGWGRERRGLQAFIQLGPQFGFYLDESTDTNIEQGRPTWNARVSNVVAQETMPVENKFDYGIVGGAGIEFSHPKVGHFLLEGRYYFGLANIYGNSKSDYFAKSNQSNIVVKLSYLFDIIKTKNDKIR
jgi:hypothetical protein